MGGNLTCVCCKEPVPVDDAGFFAQVFLCRRCAKLAERLKERGLAEIEQLRVVLVETIRLSALKGELHVAAVDDPNRRDLLPYLATLAVELRKEVGRGEQP